MARISPLKEFDPVHWRGVTKKEHLGSIGATEPQKAQDMVQILYNANFGTNMMTYIKKRYGVKKLESNEDFRWMLQGSTRFNYPLLKAEFNGSVVTSSTTNIGEAGSTFVLYFKDRAFSPNDIIVGERNSVYPIRVMQEQQTSTGWKYTCISFLPDDTASIPGSELVAGKRFSRDTNAVEKAFSKRGTNVSYTSPFSMKNDFSQIRMEMKVPGDMAYDKRKSAFTWTTKNKDGKTVQHTTWMEKMMWEMEQQWEEMKDLTLNYSTSNKKEDGSYGHFGDSGEILSLGSGLEEQSLAGNTRYYGVTNNTDGSDLDIDMLTNYIMDITDSSKKTDNKNVFMRTGKWGHTQFNKAIKNKTSQYDRLSVQDMVTRAKEFGFAYNENFTEYYMPDGRILSVYIDPSFDDKVRNKIEHPSGYGVAKSYQYDIMDIGEENGTPNIQIYEPMDSPEITRYIAGMRCPYEVPTAMSGIANPEDAYQVHKMYTGGVAIHDPSRWVSVIPNILY